jgi:hypothetical protein
MVAHRSVIPFKFRLLTLYIDLTLIFSRLLHSSKNIKEEKKILVSLSTTREKYMFFFITCNEYIIF